MLIFADAEKFVRVLKADGGRRVRVGVIMKNTFELKLDENVTLSEAETTEVRCVIASYQEVEQAQRNLDIRRFPQILRQVTAYYQDSATEFEKGLLSTAIAEAQRMMRRVDLKDLPSREVKAGPETTPKKSRGRR